jgi:Methyltransferase domain
MWAAGPARRALRLAVAGADVLAVDPSEAVLRRLHDAADRLGVTVTTRQADLGQLGEATAEYDLVVCHNVLSFVTDPGASGSSLGRAVSVVIAGVFRAEVSAARRVRPVGVALGSSDRKARNRASARPRATVDFRQGRGSARSPRWGACRRPSWRQPEWRTLDPRSVGWVSTPTSAGAPRPLCHVRSSNDPPAFHEARKTSSFSGSAEVGSCGKPLSAQSATPFCKNATNYGSVPSVESAPPRNVRLVT